MNKIKYLWILGIIIFLLTAIFSVGYYHWDEHFQILEFAGFKLDYTSTDSLPWEYKSQIRPTFQPALAFVVIKAAQTLGINSHFSQAMVIRILMGLFSLAVVYFFTQTLLPKIKPKYQAWFIFLSLFLFFIPYLSVRFSSESLSGILFILGLGMIIKKYDREQDRHNVTLINTTGHDILIGIILGLTFATRFQSFFLIIGLGLWLIIFGKIKLKNILSIILGGLLAIGTGTIIDYWFYGQLIFTPYNYFITNIVEDVASQWGIYPWWQYFIFSTDLGLISVFGYLLIIFSLLFFVKNYKNAITSSVVPFLIIHCIVPHKELRFLFPIAWLIPYIIIDNLQFIFGKITNRILKIPLYLFVLFIMGINIMVLLMKTFSPADGGILIYKYLYNNYSKQNTTVYYLDEGMNFVGRQGYLLLSFYDPNHFVKNKIMAKDIGDLKPKTSENILIIAKTSDRLSWPQLKIVYQILPDFITKKYDSKNRMYIKNADWVVYKVEK